MSRAPMLVLLVVVSVLAAGLELLFQYTYLGPVPLPLGSLGLLLTMPWLVRTFVEVVPNTLGAAAAPILWFLTTAVFGALGPGGDALLVEAWQTFLLLGTGVIVGLVCFRRAVERLAAAPPPPREGDGEDAGRPSDPRIRGSSA